MTRRRSIQYVDEAGQADDDDEGRSDDYRMIMTSTSDESNGPKAVEREKLLIFSPCSSCDVLAIESSLIGWGVQTPWWFTNKMELEMKTKY